MLHCPPGDDEDILEDDEPDLDTVMIQHPGAVNRIRVRGCVCPRYYVAG